MSNIETRQEAFLKALSSAGISPEYQGDGVFTGQSRLFEMVFDAACNWQASAQDGGEAVAYPNCDTCGGSMDYMPWHYSTEFERHKHACDKCWPEVNPANPPSAVVPDDSKHHAVRQAQMWAQEVRTQKAIVREIGKLVGCNNDWEMVEALRNALSNASGGSLQDCCCGETEQAWRLCPLHSAPLEQEQEL